MTNLRMPAFAGELILAAPARTRRRTGYVGRLIAALHYSRRLQAQSVLRRYRHLLDDGYEPGTNRRSGQGNLTHED
jgi:hypothetical protein